MARGVGKRPLFDDDQDKDVFANRLARCIQETGTSIFAWVLMPNHLHLLTRTDGESLSRLMQKLLTGHAVYYNKRHDRVGHLSQNRFKSILVQAEEYLLSLVRYIHLNPLTAGIVKFPDSLESYRWSGHRGIIHPRALPWMNRSEVLDYFSEDGLHGVPAYLDYLEEDELKHSEQCFSTGSLVVNSKGLIPINQSFTQVGYKNGFPILGTRSFGVSVLRKLRASDAGTSRLRRPEHHVLMSIVRLVEDHWNLPAGSLHSGGRSESIVRAREVLAFVMIDTLGLKLRDSASMVGLSSPGAHGAAGRFRRRMDTEPESVEGLLNQIYRVIKQ